MARGEDLEGLLGDVSRIEDNRLQRRKPAALSVLVVAGVLLVVGGGMSAWFAKDACLATGPLEVRWTATSTSAGGTAKLAGEEQASPSAESTSRQTLAMGRAFPLAACGAVLAWFVAGALCLAYAAKIERDAFQACLVRPSDLLSLDKLRSLLREENRKLMNECREPAASGDPAGGAPPRPA